MTSLIYLPQCSSTNDEILHFLPMPESQDVMTVCTFNQTKGRGQYGNVWENFPNQNLAFSMAVKTDKVSISDSIFNFHTANILRDFIANLTQTDTKVKWPNDIIVNHKKVSGMLIEKKTVQRETYFIVGIGVNILQTDFKHLPKAGSILTQANQRFDLKEWCEAMQQYLEEHLLDKANEEEVLLKYNLHLFRKDIISVFEKQGIRQNGIIKEVTNDGRIWIDLEDEGHRSFYHKEIEMLY